MEKTGPERAAYLTKACAGDADLLREAESLLARDPSPSGLLGAGGVAIRLRQASGHADVSADESGASALPIAHGPPESIGPYRILDLLGEGGMGIVYRAEQTSPIRREVAIKLLRRDFGSARVLERFEAEKQTLARMQHPDIAAVIDAGFDEAGTPYFVMELVAGVSITAYCDRERLDVPARIRLFVRVCRALQHAHEKGVIHRDLKPSNILVTDRAGVPLPKVIDFGIARAVGEARGGQNRTMEGQILGTPEYMSPEQARGNNEEVDTRMDVYALGVVLYEILAGRLPYETHHGSIRDRPVIELIRAIHERAPLPLGVGWRGRGRPPADLETILAKSLEKDPARRTRGAGELADDLERFLDGQPIHAHPPSATYQIGKLIARHRIPFALAGALLLAIVTLLVTMSTLYRKASLAERERAIEARTAQRTTDFMVGLFKVSEPSQSLGKTITAREILDRAAGDVTQALHEEPTVQATLMHTLGRVYMSLGLYESGVEMTEAALAKRRALFGERHADVVESQEQLGWTYYLLGRYDDAETALRKAIATREGLAGPEHLSTAVPIEYLSQVLYARGEFHECQRLQKRALAIKEKSLGPEHVEVATTLGNTAAAALDAGRYDEARTYLERAIRIYEREYGRDHFLYASATIQVGYLEWSQGNVLAAEKLFSSALPIFERTMGLDHPRVATYRKDLGGIQASLGRYREAKENLEAALRVEESRLGPDHADLAMALTWLGLVEVQGFDNVARAESLHRRAIANTEKASGPEAATLSSRLVNLGWTLEVQGRLDEAEASFERALVLANTGYGPEHYKTGRCLNYLGYLAQERGDHARAESLYAASLTVYGKVADRYTTAHVLRELAEVRCAGGDAASANSLLVTVRTTCEKEGWMEQPIYAATMEDLETIARRRAARPFRRVVIP